MSIDQRAISESEALRRLNLPTSRRGWLRGQLPSVPLSVGNIHERSAVEALAEKLARFRDPELLPREANSNLHHR